MAVAENINFERTTTDELFVEDQSLDADHAGHHQDGSPGTQQDSGDGGAHQVTGSSASELIRDLRLKKAAELLREGELNVTEVSYEIGISSLSNFAKIFKTKYGEIPSEYAQTNRDE